MHTPNLHFVDIPDLANLFFAENIISKNNTNTIVQTSYIYHPKCTKAFDNSKQIFTHSTRITNLLSINTKDIPKDKNSYFLGAQTKDSVNRKNPFMKKVIHIILNELENENFSIHHLSKELYLSRSQVHRKIKAITGMSAAIYIRYIRLLKAKQLLQATERSISEILYEVGFKSAAYFSQAYKETFGETPSAVRKRVKSYL